MDRRDLLAALREHGLQVLALLGGAGDLQLETTGSTAGLLLAGALLDAPLALALGLALRLALLRGLALLLRPEM